VAFLATSAALLAAICRPLSMKTIYLTVDDGPSESLGSTLDFLQANDVPAILFCIGERMRRHPELVKDAVSRGFILGNHSHTHDRFSQMTFEQARRDILMADVTIEELHREAGVERRARFFRFPFGDRGGALNPPLNSYLRDLRYRHPRFNGVCYDSYTRERQIGHVDVLWTLDARDHQLTRACDILSTLNSVDSETGGTLSSSTSDDILLMHDDTTLTGVFVEVIATLLERDYCFALPAELSEEGGQACE